MAPNYAGVVLAIANGLGSFTGVVGPYIVGVITPHVSFLKTMKKINTYNRSYFSVIFDGMAHRILVDVRHFYFHIASVPGVRIRRSTGMERTRHNA